MQPESSPDGRVTRRRLVVFALVIVVLPILTLTAFHAASTIVVSNAPLFRFENGGLNSGQNQSGGGLPHENYTGSNVSVSSMALFNPVPSLNLPTVSPDEVIVMILAVFAVVTFGVVRNLRYSRRLVFGFEAEELKNERAAVAKALDDAVGKLRLGGEYRMTVLECYRLISEILEKKSSIKGSTLTAREFKDLVSKRLGLVSPHLSQATDLFEVARYSVHEITEEEAKRAIDCLSSLSNSIKEA